MLICLLCITNFYKTFHAMKNSTTTCERLFKITRKNNVITLFGSMSIINKIVSEENFENEAYQLTFSFNSNGVKKECTIVLIANECICEEEKEKLKEQLGIVLEGDGMCFEITSFTNDFTLQFDQLNSAFIVTESVKNGTIFFTKQ